MGGVRGGVRVDYRRCTVSLEEGSKTQNAPSFIDCIKACVLSLCTRLHHHVGYLTIFTGSAEVLLMLMENASFCLLFQDLQEMR